LSNEIERQRYDSKLAAERQPRGRSSGFDPDSFDFAGCQQQQQQRHQGASSQSKESKFGEYRRRRQEEQKRRHDEAKRSAAGEGDGTESTGGGGTSEPKSRPARGAPGYDGRRARQDAHKFHTDDTEAGARAPKFQPRSQYYQPQHQPAAHSRRSSAPSQEWDSTPDPLPFKQASIAEELARMKRLFERESVREQEEERVRWWK
jgi:hypothetical protein